jgi:hypothetical protein
MKKAFTLFVLILTPTMAFAQGTVVFNNQTGLVRQWTSPMDTTLINSPKGCAMAELISAPVGTALVNPEVPNFSTLASFLAANPGWAPAVPFNGGLNPGGLAVDGIFGLGNQYINVPGGATAEYFVISWTGPNGGPLGAMTTYDAAQALGNFWFGQSAIFTTATGDPTTTPAGLPVNIRDTFGGIIMGTPEPSTFALAGLGAVLLVMFRRRR